MLALVGYYDWRERRVPNWILLPGITGSFLYHSATSGISGIIAWFQGVSVPLLLLFVLFIWRVIGAGDIKLLSMIGSAVGGRKVIQIIILAFIIGAILSIFQMIKKKNLIRRWRHLVNYIHFCKKEKRIRAYNAYQEITEDACIPFSIAIVIGSFVVCHMI